MMGPLYDDIHTHTQKNTHTHANQHQFLYMACVSEYLVKMYLRWYISIRSIVQTFIRFVCLQQLSISFPVLLPAYVFGTLARSSMFLYCDCWIVGWLCIYKYMSMYKCVRMHFCVFEYNLPPDWIRLWPFWFISWYFLRIRFSWKFHS